MWIHLLELRKQLELNCVSSIVEWWYDHIYDRNLSQKEVPDDV
jgi:hypothetical protein